ncbi:metalloproteinase inhibitor 3-like [Crassostrea virginica]
MKCLIVLSLLVIFVGYANSCTCAGIPVNGCESEYSILGTVIGVQPIGTPPNDERIYTIIVRRIYKAERRIPFIVRVRWYVSGATCGILLRQGETYVISGNYGNPFFTTNSCLYTRLWRDIPHAERYNLNCRNPWM